MKLFRRKPNQKGFTMIELMVVVVVIGILAAIAIPIYGKYIKNARVSEATGRIGEIITASKAYAQEHQDANAIPQWPPTAGGGIATLEATELFTYAIQAGGGTAATGPITFRATGTGKMTGVQVDVTVPSITSNGTAPVVTGL
jgi:prepilin-type N-terminal cleavage/methylation domain-containing protein